MDWFTNFLNPLIGGLPNIIQAILLLLIAWAVAAILRAVIVKILNKAFAKKLSVETDDAAKAKTGSVKIIGNIVFAIVFCLFLPGALDKLGMTNVSAPITTMATTFLNFLPNIIAAIIIVAFGVFLSKLIMQLLSAGLKKTKIDRLQDKWGVEHKDGAGFSDIIARFVYVIIMIIFVVAAIQVLNISAISAPATQVVNSIFGIIPNLFVAVILIVFGVFLANLVGKLLENILSGTGMDKFVSNTLPQNSKFCASKVIATIVKVVIDIIFIVAAIKVLNIAVLSKIGTAVIAYMPQVLAAVIVLVLAWFLGGWAEKLILKNNESAQATAVAAKVAIIVLAVFMALSQLGIAANIVNILFIAVVGAVAIAVAIAFGIGGKDFAKHTLNKIDKKDDK